MQSGGRVVVVVRHGETRYLDGNKVGASLSSAFDLTDRGIENVQQTARALSELGVSMRKFVSSPMSRTLHTTRVLMQTLGHEIDETKETQFVVEEALREVRGWDLQSFLRCLTEITGRNEFEERERHELYNEEVIFKPEHQARLSEPSLQFTAGLERNEQLMERALRLLNSLNGGEVLVTHDGVVQQFLKAFECEKTSLARGKFIVLRETEQGKWKIEQTNNTSEW